MKSIKMVYKLIIVPVCHKIQLLYFEIIKVHRESAQRADNMSCKFRYHE